VDGLSAAQRANLRAQLTIRPRKTTDIAAAKVPEPIELFREDGERFAVPRGFWRKRRSGAHAERLAVSYGTPMQPLASTWTAEGPFAEQAQIVAALQRALTAEPWGGGLLEAACGTGKSEVGIELAHRLGCSTMILVHKEFLLRQWRKRIQKVLPGARVGIVQQDRCEWEDMDFSIALMQSLVRDDGCGAKYDPRMYQHFGLVLVDEAHHVPSATFSQVLPRFSAAMLLGLSATFRRRDGTEDVFYYQLGPVIYTASAKPMIPQVRVLKTETTLAPIRRGWDPVEKAWRYEVEVDKLNSAQVLTQLAEDEPRQRIIVDQVIRAVRGGRKVLVISERLEHLRDMARVVGAALPQLGLPWVPTQDYYTGQWFTGQVWDRAGKGHRKGEPKRADRSEAELETAEGAQVLWATRQLVDEGFDVTACDVLILALPVADIEQILGRIQRWCFPDARKCARLCPWRAGTCEGKPVPVVVDVVDPRVVKVMGKWRKRQQLYRSMGIQL
jgi:superfamily II DNA or RNA helicase